MGERERVDWLKALGTQVESDAPAGDGARVDSAVVAWSKDAARNKGVLSRKQKADQARVRVKYDLPPELKQEIEQAAREEKTSASQLAAFLLAWAMREYAGGSEELREALADAARPSRALRFERDLELP